MDSVDDFEQKTDRNWYEECAGQYTLHHWPHLFISYKDFFLFSAISTFSGLGVPALSEELLVIVNAYNPIAVVLVYKKRKSK